MSDPRKPPGFCVDPQADRIAEAFMRRTAQPSTLSTLPTALPADPRKLIAEGLGHEERMSREPWASNGYGIIDASGDLVTCLLNKSDDHPAIAWLRNNARTILTGYEAALDEAERLRECLRTAGLRCFMRDGSPADVAKHMQSVAASWSDAGDRIVELETVLTNRTRQISEPCASCGASSGELCCGVTECVCGAKP